MLIGKQARILKILRNSQFIFISPLKTRLGCVCLKTIDKQFIIEKTQFSISVDRWILMFEGSVYFKVFTSIEAAALKKCRKAKKKLCQTTHLTQWPKGRKPFKSCLFLPTKRKTTPNYPPSRKAERSKNIFGLLAFQSGWKLGKVFLSAFQPFGIFLAEKGHGGKVFTSK